MIHAITLLISLCYGEEVSALSKFVICRRSYIARFLQDSGSVGGIDGCLMRSIRYPFVCYLPSWMVTSCLALQEKIFECSQIAPNTPCGSAFGGIAKYKLDFTDVRLILS